MTQKTLISLRRGTELHNISLDYDSATVEMITEEVIKLVSLYRMAEGDTLTVGVINVAETRR